MTDPGRLPARRRRRSRSAALAFADADGAKRWAKSLPITSVAPLYEAVLGQLRALSAAQPRRASARRSPR